MRATRMAGVSGVGFVVLLGASVLIEGARPDTFASDEAIHRFFAEAGNQDRAAVAAFLLIPAAALFLFFLAGLHDLLHRGDMPSGLSLAAMGGGVWFVAFIVLAKLVDNITGASLAFSDTFRVEAQEARLASGLAYWIQGASMAGAAVLLVGASRLSRRAGLVGRRVEVVGYAIAVTAPAAVALNGVPILLFLLWVLATGVFMASGRVGNPVASNAREGRVANGRGRIRSAP
jgi:hypothetical protein